MNYNGSWVTIGDSGWSLNEARVVCRQLGCGAALSVSKGNEYGKSSGPAFLDNVKCKGTESSLAECQAATTSSKKCICGSYAGAVCEGHSGIYSVQILGIMTRKEIILSSLTVGFSPCPLSRFRHNYCSHFEPTGYCFTHWGFIVLPEEKGNEIICTKSFHPETR